MSSKEDRAAAEVLRAVVAALSAPLSDDDRRLNWSPKRQRVMLDWFRMMLKEIEAGRDIRNHFSKITRELDMHGIIEGDIWDVCVASQLRLTELLGRPS